MYFVFIRTEEDEVKLFPVSITNSIYRTCTYRADHTSGFYFSRSCARSCRLFKPPGHLLDLKSLWYKPKLRDLEGEETVFEMLQSKEFSPRSYLK